VCAYVVGTSVVCRVVNAGVWAYAVDLICTITIENQLINGGAAGRAGGVEQSGESLAVF